MSHSAPVNNVLKEIYGQAGIVQFEGKCMIPLSQQMGSSLWLAISREHALLVTTHTSVGCKAKVFIKDISLIDINFCFLLTLFRLEVRKVPHKFTNKPVEPAQLIESLKMLAKQLGLVFLGPYVGRQLGEE